MAVARDSRERHYYHQHALQSERLHRLHAYAGRSLVVLVLGASLPQILTKLPSRNAGYHHHHHHHHLPLPRKPDWYTVHVHSTEIKSLSLWYIPLQFAFFLIIFILFYLFAVASGNETWEGGGMCVCVGDGIGATFKPTLLRFHRNVREKKNSVMSSVRLRECTDILACVRLHV